MYDFHPEVRRDLDEIWEFISTDDPAAADRVISEIIDSIDALVPFPDTGSQAPGSHFTSATFHSGV
jgi:plasmid stabilization system protein ParE